MRTNLRKVGPLVRRQINRDKWRRRAARFAAAGKTTRGTARKQKQWTELESRGKARDRDRDTLRYRQNHAPHLLPSQLERDYHQAFRAGLNICPPVVNASYEQRNNP